ncbi:hypothetical protein DERF_004096 [Dermatophagoides farinae]|uniref:Uncharacterized protein n=1 Tax=Dermatophagoides farinae TaxID=6954 RepID=A0A922IEX8_DERFA|nr:hypothetical protein DERF_004096 [Dermatophagoides farinae]
MSELELEFRR